MTESPSPSTSQPQPRSRSPTLPTSIASCRILWSTQSGKAKACARRTARILEERTGISLEGGIGCPFDESPVPLLEMLTRNQSHGNQSNNNNNSSSSSSRHNKNGTLFLMFVSTTGDGEHCDSIRATWRSLLQKSLPGNLLADSPDRFALFCLGDRAYGPQFCAAGRKLGVRLLRLGSKALCEVGYGDDNTPGGGVFRDLDEWLEQKLVPGVASSSLDRARLPSTAGDDNDEKAEWKKACYEESYREYFRARGPVTAYSYNSSCKRVSAAADDSSSGRPTAKRQIPWIGSVTVNDRITAPDWNQDTRHLEIRLRKPTPKTRDSSDHAEKDGSDPSENDSGPPPLPLPYIAGDVASILPFNSRDEVDRFLGVLPESVSSVADDPLRIDLDESFASDNRFTRWPTMCTLRGWLTFCADIHSLPEREDLRALSVFCGAPPDAGQMDGSLDQASKLRSLSETSEAALYADYILREKRSWIDVLHDFESLRAPGSRLTLEALLRLLPPMRPRDFSIASAPSMDRLRREVGLRAPDGPAEDGDSFSIELCVGVVEGTTRLGRSYHGLCSEFLSRIAPSGFATTTMTTEEELRVWIRPGTFGKMPTALINNHNGSSISTSASFDVPIVCVGAGTGIAPMRSLLLERMALHAMATQTARDSAAKDRSQTNDGKTSEDSDDTTTTTTTTTTTSAADEKDNENILVFGCRKQTADFYYREEWERLTSDEDCHFRILKAFSQDQAHKIYVQKVLREADDGTLIARHILEKGGAVFIAGGPKMARAVKQEIVEALTDVLPGGEKQAHQILNKMQRMGRFGIEAWS
eukprot:jgi/Psemu1/204414/e_gw1.348.61.1